jgi:hypothetical protein
MASPVSVNPEFLMVAEKEIRADAIRPPIIRETRKTCSSMGEIGECVLSAVISKVVQPGSTPPVLSPAQHPPDVA